MPRPHTAMRKIREVLRLRLGEGLSHRKVAAALGLPTSTVTGYVQRAQIAGVTWPLPPDMDDEELEPKAGWSIQMRSIVAARARFSSLSTSWRW